MPRKTAIRLQCLGVRFCQVWDRDLSVPQALSADKSDPGSVSTFRKSLHYRSVALDRASRWAAANFLIDVEIDAEVCKPDPAYSNLSNDDEEGWEGLHALSFPEK